MPNHDARAVANEFIKLAKKHGKKPLTHMQLQKLVYIAHGWSFALGEEEAPLIADTVEAWDWGQK